MARPLYTAPPVPSSYSTNAFWPSTAGAQAVIVPPSPSKMNLAGPEVLPCVTTKSVVPFATMPVGSAGPLSPAGMFTTRVWRRPVPSYNVAVCVRLFATHTVAPDANTIPHGLTRFASLVAAATAPSDTSLLKEYALGVGVGAGVGAVEGVDGGADCDP